MNIRDYEKEIDNEDDIAMARAGDLALNGLPLIERRGIEVGNIFQLGYHYTNLMKGAVYRDEDGKEKPFYMGCYGIGIGRTMATLVEKYHDDKGILWPEFVSPFRVHFIALNLDKPEVQAGAEKVYQQFLEQGVEVLYDDRDVSAGVKFADSDLVGIPYRIIISSKTLAQESVEMKKRNDEKGELVKINDMFTALQ